MCKILDRASFKYAKYEHSVKDYSVLLCNLDATQKYQVKLAIFCRILLLSGGASLSN